jgi:ribonuclease D
MHSYFHKVCLIQVTVDDHHFVIDPLGFDLEDLSPLLNVVRDETITVLMHGADYDLRVLDRDFGAKIRGLQDTQIMARLLGEPRTGLAVLLEREIGVQLDKRHQRADWGRRPLTPGQLAYAAADTAHLGLLADRLRSRLEEMGRWAWAEEEFLRLEDVRHVPSETNPHAFERIKGARALRGGARDRLFTLFGWRDRQAQKLDVPPFKILGNRQIIDLAEKPPADLKGLQNVDGVGPRAVRRWGKKLLAHLQNPGSAPERLRGPREPAPDPAIRRRLKRLLAVRDPMAEELGFEPGLLCPRSCAEAVAARQPRCGTFEDLNTAGLDGWRLEVLGEKFLKALADG